MATMGIKFLRKINSDVPKLNNLYHKKAQKVKRYITTQNLVP